MAKVVLEKIKRLSNQEKQNLSYKDLVKIMGQLETNEIIELSNIIGYPVFTRLCMGVLRHSWWMSRIGRKI